MARQHDTPRPGRLRLRPFRAMRFNPDVVGDIAAVTSPPYDVMDWQMIDDLLTTHPHNIVRLIFPRMVDDPAGSFNAYAKGARRLNRWRQKGVLLTDPEPALYVYEYGDADHRVCGLVGALDLPKKKQRVILPHEDTIAGIVAERIAMMAAQQANLEPILLVYDGAGGTEDVIAKARTNTPLVSATADDGTLHRLWAITDPTELATVRSRIADHQALIADGHHRYEMYRQLRRRHRSIGDGPGPWDRGLAMLIDQSQCPLRVGSVHRSVAELSLAALHAPEGFVVDPPRPLGGEVPLAPATSGELVLTDGTDVRRVRATAAGPTVSDAELLHEQLLPAWRVTEDRVGYHHAVPQALRTAVQDGGVAVLMHPASVADVMEVARAGRTLPRKSTSFGPKPRMGVVMRAFADEH